MTATPFDETGTDQTMEGEQTTEHRVDATRGGTARTIDFDRYTVIEPDDSHPDWGLD